MKDFEPGKRADVWMWFIRTTIPLAWLVGSWAIKTLLLVDKNQALMVQQLSEMNGRVVKVETRLDKKDEDEKDWLRNRIERDRRTR